MKKINNHYELLEVEPQSDTQSIKRAYKRAVLKYHPDVCKRRDAVENFRNILEAYKVLADERSRKLYDLDLKAERRHPLRKSRSENKARSQAKKANDRHAIWGVWYYLLFQFISIPDVYQMNRISLDPLVRKMKDNELESRFFESQNRYVKINAMHALRKKRRLTSLSKILSQIHQLERPLIRETIRCFSGLPLKKALQTILSVYQKESEEIKREIHLLLKQLDKGLLLYSLHRYKENRSLGLSESAASLMQFIDS